MRRLTIAMLGTLLACGSSVTEVSPGLDSHSGTGTTGVDATSGSGSGMTSASSSGSQSAGSMTTSPGSDGTTTDAPTGSSGGSSGCAQQTLYQDLDGDGFGDDAVTMEACRDTPGFVPEGGDCNDDAMGVNPDAQELCDGQDTDCDGGQDEGSPSNPSCNGCDFSLSPDGTWYGACAGPLPWAEARMVCEAQGGDLAVIGSEAEHDFALTINGGVDRWVSLNDLDTEGEWFWADGTQAATGGNPIGLMLWWGSEPDDFGAGEDCGQLASGLDLWGDAPCDSNRAFFCEHD